MRYFRQPLFKPLEQLVETGEPLSEYEIAKLMGTLTNDLLRRLLIERELCKFDDGREAWMVRYEKYMRVKRENQKLRKENERLRKAIVSVSVSEPCVSIYTAAQAKAEGVPTEDSTDNQ